MHIFFYYTQHWRIENASFDLAQKQMCTFHPVIKTSSVGSTIKVLASRRLSKTEAILQPSLHLFPLLADHLLDQNSQPNPHQQASEIRFTILTWFCGEHILTHTRFKKRWSVWWGVG